MNNVILVKSVILSFAGLMLVAFSASADTSVEGLVKDAAGHPVTGADVRIEAKNFSKVIKTDPSGRYACGGLGAGTYKVTLLVAGQVKASILNAKTQSGKATQLNFNLTGETAKKHTHMVYVAPDTGTHIGGGRWVEVDDNGNVVNNSGTGASSVEKASSSALQQGRIYHGRNPGGP